MWSDTLIKEWTDSTINCSFSEVGFIELGSSIDPTNTLLPAKKHILFKMCQPDRESLQQLEGFYRIIGNRSKYWEIHANSIKQYDPHGLFPESNELSIEYGDFGNKD